MKFVSVVGEYVLNQYADRPTVAGVKHDLLLENKAGQVSEINSFKANVDVGVHLNGKSGGKEDRRLLWQIR